MVPQLAENIRVAKKLYLLALGLFLVIPFAAILGSTLATAINPEIAAHYANYVRNYRLLALAQGGVRLAALLAIMGLWFSTGFFLLKSKGRSYWWLLLSILGPFGFVPLTMLGDSAPARHDSHQRFSRLATQLLEISL